jgi:hypothetical protein
MNGGNIMSNIAKVLKAEIMRISRKEAKGATQGIGKTNTWLRKTVADLKKRVVLLEKERIMKPTGIPFVARKD